MNETGPFTILKDASARDPSAAPQRPVRDYIHYGPAYGSRRTASFSVGHDPRLRYRTSTRHGPNEKQTLYRAATEELYRDVTGREPSARWLGSRLRNEIAQTNDSDFVITALRQDEPHSTKFYLGQLGKLTDFGRESRRRLLSDAISHLRGLQSDAAGRTELAGALAEIRDAGNLDRGNESRLAGLTGSPDLRRSFPLTDRRIAPNRNNLRTLREQLSNPRREDNVSRD